MQQDVFVFHTFLLRFAKKQPPCTSIVGDKSQHTAECFCTYFFPKDLDVKGTMFSKLKVPVKVFRFDQRTVCSDEFVV